MTAARRHSTRVIRRFRTDRGRDRRVAESADSAPRDRSSVSSPQPIHIHQPQPHAAVGLDAALPVGRLHVDRREADAVPLRVLDERRRMIEPHRLVVQHRREERRRVVRLQVGAGIDEQREARRSATPESHTAQTT